MLIHLWSTTTMIQSYINHILTIFNPIIIPIFHQLMECSNFPPPRPRAPRPPRPNCQLPKPCHGPTMAVAMSPWAVGTRVIFVSFWWANHAVGVFFGFFFSKVFQRFSHLPWWLFGVVFSNLDLKPVFASLEMMKMNRNPYICSEKRQEPQ